MTTDALTKARDECLDELDFEKIHRIMAAEDWTWDSTQGVPAIADLRRQARELLDDVIKRGEGYSSTGGFWAELRHGLLTLQWGVSWEVELDDEE